MFRQRIWGWNLTANRFGVFTPAFLCSRCQCHGEESWYLRQLLARGLARC